MREPALAVVGKNHRIRGAQHAREVLKLRRQHFMARRLLEVHPQQLLAAADHAQLDRGRDAPVAVKLSHNALPREQALEPRAGFVGANHREQAYRRPQRGRVARNIGGAAGTLLDPVDPDDGHWRFRRDPPNVSKPVAVQHHVADYQQPGLAQGRRIRDER
ncbi:hypothetical protein D3C83_15730 [compost metagenome]